MPYIVFPIFEYNRPLVFILFGIIGFAGAFASFNLPTDRLNKPLDWSV